VFDDVGPIERIVPGSFCSFWLCYV
jgi:hypothetical protein